MYHHSSVKKKFGSGSIFCVFASVECILIGRDGEYEKKRQNALGNFGLSVQWPLHKIPIADFFARAN